MVELGTEYGLWCYVQCNLVILNFQYLDCVLNELEVDQGGVCVYVGQICAMRKRMSEVKLDAEGGS